MNLPDEPIALIHWGDPNVEFDEIGEILFLLEATLYGDDVNTQAKRAPFIDKCWIDSPSVEGLQNDLSAFISGHRNLQIIYFTCHGNPGSFCFGESCDTLISSEDFCEILSRSLTRDCVHLVFGSCGAMAPREKIEQFMPSTVNAVSGFTYRPNPQQVAGLISSIIQDDVSLLEQLITGNANVCNGDVSSDQIPHFIEMMKRTLDNHTEHPTREVQGNDGIAVITTRRDDESGDWRRTYTLCDPHNIDQND